MGKYVMVVASSAQPGRDHDYNAWYDDIHLHDICALPGVVSGKRFNGVPSPNELPGQYLALYEIETDDVNAVLAEMARRVTAGEVAMSDALDIGSAKMWFYEAR